MNRRLALKQLAIAAGSMALLPACDFGPKRAAIVLDNLKLDINQQDLLARISEIIIPSTDGSPGAEALGLYRFVLVMVDDCHSAEEQTIFTSGLQKLEAFADEHLDKSFSKGDQVTNEALLTELLGLEGLSGEANEALEDIQATLAIIKRYTIQGYMNSEYFMTEKFPYQLVPGSYQACVPTQGLTIM